PYAWSNSLNTGDVKVYMKASTGATISHSNGKNTWPVNGGFDFDDCVGTSAGDTTHWLPYIDVINASTPTTVTVKDNDNPEVDENTYKIYLEVGPAKTERVISDI